MTVPDEDDRSPAKVNNEWTIDRSTANFIACNTGGPSRDIYSADIFTATTTNLTPDDAGELLRRKIRKEN